MKFFNVFCYFSKILKYSCNSVSYAENNSKIIMGADLSENIFICIVLLVTIPRSLILSKNR